MTNKNLAKSRVLHIIPYSNLYPPMNGGQLRCFHLMDKLSNHFKMDVVCYQSNDSIKNSGYVNDNITFYSASSFKKKEGLLKLLPNRLKNALRYRILTKSLFNSASKEVLEFAHVIKELSKTNKYELIIYEHLTGLSLHPFVKKCFPTARYVLDAHNVDHLLIDPKNKVYFERIKTIESLLHKSVDEIWACSHKDLSILRSLNNNRINGLVVPNGVDIESKKFVENKQETYNSILFCGTLDSPPNKEGLLWFYNKIWPSIINEYPKVKLIVIGKGNRSPFKNLELDSSVDFIGEVEDVEPYYSKAFIAVVPLLSGSGTRLKILEAMSFGNPIVTTSKGIEGIEFDEDKHVRLANSEVEMAKKIISLINNTIVGIEMRNRAYDLVKHKYDWNIIVKNLVKNYPNLITK